MEATQNFNQKEEERFPILFKGKINQASAYLKSRCSWEKTGEGGRLGTRLHSKEL